MKLQKWRLYIIYIFVLKKENKVYVDNNAEIFYLIMFINNNKILKTHNFRSYEYTSIIIIIESEKTIFFMIGKS